MAVERIWAGGVWYSATGAGYSSDGEVIDEAGAPVSPAEGALYKTLLVGTLANESQPSFLIGDNPVGDPTELAIHVSAAKELRSDWGQLDILPFESEHRFMATLNERNGKTWVLLKGAPEAVLACCHRPLAEDGREVLLDAEFIRAASADLADEGLRVLGISLRG